MKRNYGFTLIELATVIAILAILAAILSPSVFKWEADQKFNGAVRGLQSQIVSLRLAALKENIPATISFTNGASTYQTTEFRKTKKFPNGQYLTVTHTLPNGVTANFNPTDPTSTAPLTFNGRGLAISGTQDTSGTITIQGPNGLHLNIDVNITGNAQIS